MQKQVLSSTDYEKKKKKNGHIGHIGHPSPLHKPKPNTYSNQTLTLNPNFVKVKLCCRVGKENVKLNQDKKWSLFGHTSSHSGNPYCYQHLKKLFFKVVLVKVKS